MRSTVRVLSAALLLCLMGGAARASCGGPGAAAGDHGDATVTFTAGSHTVNIHTAAFGNFAAGPAQACADGSVPGLAPTTGFLKITVDGTVVCTNSKKAPAFDPFVFGGGIHNDETDACGADMTWDGLSWAQTPTVPSGPPDPPPAGADTSGAWAGDEQPAIVTGWYWYGGPTQFVPNGVAGWFSNHGAQVRAYT